MKNYSRSTPEGVRDILFEECLRRRDVSGRLAGVFRSRGYNEVITPGIEYYDVFAAGDAAIPQEEMYKATDSHGRLIVLRPDLTPPIARLAAVRLADAERPLRLYYDQTVYRSRRALSGRNDETAQAGIELLGAGGLRADLEVICCAVDALASCTKRFRLEIGDARLFRALAEKLPVSQEERENIRQMIESKDYAALGDALGALPQTDWTRALAALPRLFGGAEVFAEAERCFAADPALSATLGELRSLYESLSWLGLGDRLMADLGLVQRNDYYTGVAFSAYVEGHGDAVLMGGRYDDLLARFGQPMPAIGFAADVDALAKTVPALEPTVPEVLVHGAAGYELLAQRMVRRLTREGRTVESSVFGTEEEARRYAARRGIPEVIVVDGKAEVAE